MISPSCSLMSLCLKHEHDVWIMCGHVSIAITNIINISVTNHTKLTNERGQMITSLFYPIQVHKIT